MHQDTGIALLALFTAVLSAYLTRVHNRLSVRPYLRLDHDFENGIKRIFFKNSGLGPAILKSIRVKYKNEIMDCSVEDWGKNLPGLISEEYKKNQTNRYKIYPSLYKDIF